MFTPHRNATLKLFLYYDQAIKKDPKDFRPVLAKAMLLKEQGKITEAKPLFDSAVALAPAQYKDEINKEQPLLLLRLLLLHRHRLLKVLRSRRGAGVGGAGVQG